MVHLSCFNSLIHSHKTKKQAQPSFATMIQMLKADSQNDEPVNDSTWSNQSSTVEKKHNGLISEEMIGNMSKNYATQNGKNFKRSLSFGCASPHEAWDLEDTNSEGNNDPEFFVNDSYDQPSLPGSPKSREASISYQDHEVRHLSSPHGCDSEKLTIETISSYMEKDEDAESVQFEIEYEDDSSNHAHPTQHIMAKSQSVPNFASILPTLRVGSVYQLESHYSKPHGGLKPLDTLQREISISEDLPEQNDEHEESLDGYDSNNCAAFGKDWIIPTLDDDEVCSNKKFDEASSYATQKHMPTKNFMMKRIEDWVIDLQEFPQSEEPEEIVDTLDQKKRQILSMIDEKDTTTPHVGMNPVAEVAKKYVFSLSANATIAQLTNYGLVVIPFLSAFVSLKVVNLSGNSIVRITAGALPRGLHMLNLSKNKISAIEGLRELTRLRILDISYNKITRIARGLASCSSLKELYLAGNKIGEVDGLHRLLKLNVLDLRFNKISTTKGLGLLAANYNSLQAISVEGNPAQKNVGDEQLKKYLQGLLPNLAYYNRRSTRNKSNSFKDSSARSIRSDRSHKSDNKMRRTTSYSSFGTKQSGHKGQGTGKNYPSKRSTRGRYGNLPPTNSHRHHRYDQQFEMNMKPLDLTKAFSMRKSQSVGNLTKL